MSEHLIGIDQTYRFSPIWEIRCTCGWTHPYDETVARDVIDKHLAAAQQQQQPSALPGRGKGE